ncbi:hypothetical protein BY458DRAFT_505578 [Sporodiniella umbellata]|nr:hypothetical protein BY458DRAFT_505578 [Sporodiniella umbellata]
MVEMNTRSPIVDIDIPVAIPLGLFPLLFIHLTNLLLDYVILKRADKIPNARHIVIGLHIILPFVFTSHERVVSALFSVIPWASGMHSCTIDVTKMSFGDWIESSFRIIVDPRPSNLSIRQFRYRGVAVACRGIMKVVFMTLLIEPLIPQRISYALYYPWYHPMTIAYNILFGTAVYLNLGYIEFFMGIQQIVTGWNILEFFNAPYLASSPKDFWSVRWNKVVQNMLHSMVFSRKENQSAPLKEKEEKLSCKNEKQKALSVVKDTHKNKEQSAHATSHSKTAPSKKYIRGFLTFFVSGIFHEMIIVYSCRKITLENLLFFCIQGVAVALEVAVRQGALKQNPEGKNRILCVMAQLTFMAFSGRLFLGPFLRYNFLHDKPFY